MAATTDRMHPEGSAMARDGRRSRTWDADLISSYYKRLLREDHAANPNWGTTGKRYANFIHPLYHMHSCLNILDYGCGKATLSQSLGLPVHGYDPGIPEFSEQPTPHDMVVSTDVLEHVQPERVDAVLKHIHSLTRKVGFHAIALTKAAHKLPNGKNAHLTVRRADWWTKKFEAAKFDYAEVFLPCNAPRFRETVLTIAVWPNV